MTWRSKGLVTDLAKLTLGGGDNGESPAVFDFVIGGGIGTVIGAATLIFGSFNLVAGAAVIGAAILVRMFFDFVIGGGIGAIIGAATLIPIPAVVIIIIIIFALVAVVVIFVVAGVVAPVTATPKSSY